VREEVNLRSSIAVIKTVMYCPNCGANTSTEQKFCRSCGLGLEKIALSLTEQLPTRVDEPQLSQKERYERLGLVGLGVFGVGLLGAFLYGIVYQTMFVQGRFLLGLALLVLMIFMGFGLFAAIMFAKAKEAEEIAGKRRIQQVETTQTKDLLTEGNFEPVPSVTDRTTELLAVEKSRTHDR
jgi:hypothetical protein